jgi:hypothetical protein
MDRYDEALWYAGVVQASGAEVTPEAVAQSRRRTADLAESDVEMAGESFALEDEERTLRQLLDELVDDEGLLERIEYRVSSDGDSPPVVKIIYLFTERGEEQLRALQPPGQGEAS